MQHDDLIWSVIGSKQSHCSYRATIGDRGQQFCRNEYNVTGLCNRTSCPLSNSQYGTIKEIEGKCYLCIKTIERAHTPKYLWEQIELPRNYTQALEVIDEHMAYWSGKNKFKCKQRLTKIHQYLIRMRKLRKKGSTVKLVNVHKKVEQRENRREEKALSAAVLEKSIEKELLERLKQGTYGDIYNFPARQYEAALDGMEKEMEEEEEEEEEGEEDAYDPNYVKRVEYVEASDDSEDSDMEDYDGWDQSSDEEGQSGDASGDEDSEEGAVSDEPKRKLPKSSSKQGKPKRGKLSKPKVEIEYEVEQEENEGQLAMH